MISFRLFVEAIHYAIVSAGDSLIDKNCGLFDTYFEKSSVSEDGKDKDVWAPKIVCLLYTSDAADEL